MLTHWGRVTHICVSKVTIIVSDNGLSPGRRQAIIWNNAGILLIGPSGTNFSEILGEIQTFSFKKMHFKMSSAKWRPFCLGLNVLNVCFFVCFSTKSCFAHGHHQWRYHSGIHSRYSSQWSKADKRNVRNGVLIDSHRQYVEYVTHVDDCYHKLSGRGYVCVLAQSARERANRRHRE